MQVRDLMTRDVMTCTPGTDLATAGMIMLWNDCGAVPVAEDGSRTVVGMITDRDIAIAVATRHCAPDAVQVGDVMRRGVVSIGPESGVDEALETFARARVRRLPVVGTSGEAVGILSLNDIILHTATGRAGSKSALPKDPVLRTMQAVSEPWGSTDAGGTGEDSGDAGGVGTTRSNPNGRGVGDVPGIRPGIRSKLTRAGIRTLDDLADLEHDADRRRDVARQTGLSPAAALRFAGLAGLLRLEGMTDEHSRVLIEAGIDSSEKLRGESKDRLVRLLSTVEPDPVGTLEGWIGVGALGTPARR